MAGKQLPVAVGAGLVGGAAYKGAKLAYNTFNMVQDLTTNYYDNRKSKPNTSSGEYKSTPITQ